MNNMNNQYGNQYIPPQQYQSPKKKMDPRLKKIILAVIAVLLILGSIPRSYGTKGKGVSYMENNVSWHGAAPNEEQYNIAMAELKA